MGEGGKEGDFRKMKPNRGLEAGKGGIQPRKEESDVARMGDAVWAVGNG